MNLSNNPVVAAAQVREQIGWQNPQDFTLEEVAHYFGIFIKDNNQIKSEGRIAMKGGNGVISIRQDIVLPVKRNFIVAHELGHFFLHKNIVTVFDDNLETLSEWYKNGPQEQEANQFATALLMPEGQFQERIANQKLSVGLVREISGYFGVSMTATFIKYAECGKYPLMVIFVYNGKVAWKKHSLDFPFVFLPYGSLVPAYSVAGDLYYHGRVERQPEKVQAIEWFPEDFKCQREPDTQLWEQCYRVAENGIISCLWV